MRSIHWDQRGIVLSFCVVSQALIIGVETFSFPFWVVPWADEFAAPRAEFLLAITAAVLMSGVFAPFAGYALDRLPLLGLYCIGILATVGGLFLISVASSPGMIVVAYGTLLPIGVVLCGPLACQTIIVRLYTADRGLAIGIGSLGVSLGAFIMPPLVAALIGSFGWRHSFQILALLTLLLAPTAYLVIRGSGVSRGAPRRGAGADDGIKIAAVLRQRDFWLIAVGFLAMQSAYLPVLYNVGAYAHDLGIVPERVAFAMSLQAIALACGKVTFGRLADTVEHRRLYYLAAGPMAAGLLLVSFATSFPVLLAGLLLAGFVQGSYLPLISNMIVARFGPQAIGRVMGLAMVVVLSSALAPYGVGLIHQLSGSYPTGFLAFLSLLIPGSIAMGFLSTTPRSPGGLGTSEPVGDRRI